MTATPIASLVLAGLLVGFTGNAPRPPDQGAILFEPADLSILPPELLLIALAGDDDDLVGDIDARKVYTTATNVLPENKNYVRMFSDDHGRPSLRADHRMASAPGGMVASSVEWPWASGAMASRCAG